MKKTAEEIKTRVGEILGEVSMCWSETPKGVFQSSKAVDLLTEVFALMEEYRSQASQVPSDEEIETLAVKRSRSEDIEEQKRNSKLILAFEIGMKQMRSIALASHVARIKELEEYKITPNGFYVVARNSEEDWEQITQQMDSLEKAKDYLNDAFCKQKYPYAFIVAKII